MTAGEEKEFQAAVTTFKLIEQLGLVESGDSKRVRAFTLDVLSGHRRLVKAIGLIVELGQLTLLEKAPNEHEKVAIATATAEILYNDHSIDASVARVVAAAALMAWGGSEKESRALLSRDVAVPPSATVAQPADKRSPTPLAVPTPPVPHAAMPVGPDKMDADDLYNQGLKLLGEGKVSQDLQAVHYFRMAADQHHPDAQIQLARLYFHGRGVTTDYSEAIKWYRKAADRGVVEAQLKLGDMISRGLGVKQNYTDARQWYRMAAEQGSADAQTKLGDMCCHGYQGRKDFVEAAKWYREAAEQGSPIAQYRLGCLNLHNHAISGKFSHYEAAKWFRLAAEQGHAESHGWLGIMYYNGLGVLRDKIQAVQWFTHGARLGDQNSQRMLERTIDNDKYILVIQGLDVSLIALSCFYISGMLSYVEVTVPVLGDIIRSWPLWFWLLSLGIFNWGILFVYVDIKEHSVRPLYVETGYRMLTNEINKPALQAAMLLGISYIMVSLARMVYIILTKLF